MRQAKVPVDMSSEQKVILGVLSIRQLIYCIVGGSIIYLFVPFIWTVLPFGIKAKLVLNIIVALPVLAVVLPLGFIKHPKYGMYYDAYLFIKLQSRTQKGAWRKGVKPKKWMGDMYE